MITKDFVHDINMKKNSIEDKIFDILYDHEIKNRGLTRKTITADMIPELCNAVPSYYDWRPTLNDEIRIEWQENGEVKHTTMPLSLLVDDLDSRPDLYILWHSGYHDGPLNGYAKYEGKHVYFDMFNEDCYGNRKFKLYALSEDVWKQALARHKLWREYVCLHCDHDPQVYKETRSDWDRWERESEKLPPYDPKVGEVVAEVFWYDFKWYAWPPQTKSVDS